MLTLIGVFMALRYNTKTNKEIEDYGCLMIVLLYMDFVLIGAARDIIIALITGGRES